MPWKRSTTAEGQSGLGLGVFSYNQYASLAADMEYKLRLQSIQLMTVAVAAGRINRKMRLKDEVVNFCKALST
jgi:hypothetical protein